MSNISVVVPTYNAETTLAKCIKSLLEQTDSANEIIIVDDGSTDETKRISDEFAEKYSFIKVIHQLNSGRTYARKVGVEIAKGKYIAFVDSDDWVEETYIQILQETIGDADMAACGNYADYPDISAMETNRLNDGVYDYPEGIRIIKKSLFKSGYPFRFGLLPYVWNKLYKKEILMRVLDSVDKNVYEGEDVLLNCLYIMECKKISINNVQIYHYMINKDALFRKRKDSYYDNVSRIYSCLYNLFILDECGKSLLRQLDDYMRFMIWTSDKDGFGIYERVFFPFKDVPVNSDLIIYGAGTVGRIIYHQINVTEYCNIISWVDKKCVGENVDGFLIDNPDSIEQHDYDIIVLAILNPELRLSAEEWLKKTGIPESKIVECSGYEKF